MLSVGGSASPRRSAVVTATGKPQPGNVRQLSDVERLQLYQSSGAMVSKLTETLEIKLRAITAPEKVLCGLHRNHCLRRIPIMLISSKWFDIISVCIIIVNAAILCVYQPLEPPSSLLNSVVNQSSVVFTVIFTIELMLKVLALGLWGKNSYFSDKWNWLDACVVILGFVALSPSVVNISSIRLLRLLRSMTVFPGMRVVLNAIINSIPGLSHVCMLALLFIGAFSIVGITLWNGVMAGSCAYLSPQTATWELVSPVIRCALECSQFDGLCSPTFGDACPAMYVSAFNASAATIPLVQLSCVRGANPDWGQTSFDNIGAAAITSFALITTEGWTATMYGLWHTWGLPWLVSVAIMLYVFAGSLFLLELSLAVVWDQYILASTAEKTKAQRMYQLLLLMRSTGGRTGRSSVSNFSKRSVELAASFGPLSDMSSLLESMSNALSTTSSRMSQAIDSPLPDAHSVRVIGSDAIPADGDDIVSKLISDADAAITAIVREDEGRVDGSAAKDHATSLRAADVVTPAVDTQFTPKLCGCTRSAHRDHRTGGRCGVMGCRCLPALPACVSAPAKLVVRHWFFDCVFATLVVLNAIILGLEYEGMRSELLDALRLSNFGFVIAFNAELCLRILARGGKSYFTSSFNIADAAIVWLSAADALLDFYGFTGVGISALRAVRIIRVLRVIRSWRSLRVILHDVATAIPQATNALVLLLIFVLGCAVMGMQLWGGGYQGAIDDGRIAELPRLHFNTLWMAIVTVFEVIDNENWDQTLHAHMAVFGPGAAVYFVAILVIGNYLFLNVVIALVISNFEEASKVSLSNGHSFIRFNVSWPASCFECNPGSATCHCVAPARIHPQPLTSGQLPPEDSGVVTMVSFTGGVTRANSRRVLGSASRGAPKSDAVSINMSVQAQQTSSMHASLPRSSMRKDFTRAKSSARQLERGRSIRVSSLPSARSVNPPTPVAQAVSRGRRRSLGPDALLDGLRMEQPHNAGVVLRTRRGGQAVSIAAHVPPSITPESLRSPTGSTQPLRIEVNRQGEVKVLELKHSSKSLVSPEAARVRATTPGAPSDGQHWTASSPHMARYPSSNLVTATDDAEPIGSCCTPAQQVVRLVVNNKWFERISMFFILVSCVNLTLDHPQLADCTNIPDYMTIAGCQSLNAYLEIADYVITAIFALELLLQMCTKSCGCGSNSFFHDGWRMLDGLVVTVSIAAIFTRQDSVRALRSLRALRALRPLRVIARFPSLKLVVNALFAALPRVADVLVVLFLVAYIFAIIGLQNFRGMMYSCNDPIVRSEAECTGMFSLTGPLCSYAATTSAEMECRSMKDGVSFQRIWASAPSNFDNAFNALESVFELMTGENWPQLALQGVDGAGYRLIPARDANPAAYLFYILAELVFNMFLVELFAGVIVQTYHSAKDREYGTLLLSESQKQWVDNMRIVLSSQPPLLEQPPAGSCSCLNRGRTVIFKLVQRAWFEHAVTGAVLLNVVALAVQHYPDTSEWQAFQEIVNLIFTAVFALEALLRVTGLGAKQYWRSWQNRLDFLLVIGSVLSAAFTVGVFGSMMRIFRIARILRLTRVSKGIRRLLQTLFVTLPVFGNIFGILMLDYFVFAIIGMNVFSGENFNGIMNDLQIAEPYCVQDGAAANCGVSRTLSSIYWVCFCTMTTFILMNLLVAVVLAAFDQNTDGQHASSGVYKLTPAIAQSFGELWASMDSERKFMLPLQDVAMIVARLEAPMGCSKATNEQRERASSTGSDPAGGAVAVKALVDAERLLATLPLVPDDNSLVQYHAVLNALAERASINPPLGRRNSYVHLTGHLHTDAQAAPLREVAAVKRLQAIWRARRRVQQRARRRSSATGLTIQQLQALQSEFISVPVAALHSTVKGGDSAADVIDEIDAIESMPSYRSPLKAPLLDVHAAILSPPSLPKSPLSPPYMASIIHPPKFSNAFGHPPARGDNLQGPASKSISNSPGSTPRVPPLALHKLANNK